MSLVEQDFERLLKVLSEIYGDVDRGVPASDGAFSSFIEPYLRLWRTDVRGIPYSPGHFHPLEDIPHDRTIFATDASLKTLFDCGTFKVIASRVAYSLWTGRDHVETTSLPLRAFLVQTEPQTRETLLELEAELALRMLGSLEQGDFCLLDRSLMAPPVYRQNVSRKLVGLVTECQRLGVLICGVSKTSQLRLRSGEPLVGYLYSAGLASEPDSGWYYSPIFLKAQCPAWFLGQPVVTRFTPDSEYAFRVDIPWSLQDEREVVDLLGSVAYLADPAYPGYPYPLVAAHKAATIHESEAEFCRLQILEAMQSPQLRSRFLSTLRSSNYKQEAFWHR